MFKLFNKEIDSFIKFSQEKVYLIFSLLFIAFLSYGFKVTNFTLSIDEEITFQGGSLPHGWIADGRWGLALIKQLFHSYTINPYWNTLLSVSILLVSALFWCFILNSFLEKKQLSNNKKSFILFVFGAIYLSFPINANFIILSFYNFELAIGCLLVAISTWFAYLWLTNSKIKSYFISSCLCLTFAIGIYQSFICYFLTAILSLIILNSYVDNKTRIKFSQQFALLFKIFSLTFISITVYFIISTLLRLKYPSSGYVEAFIWWGRMPFHEILAQFYYFYVGHLLGNGNLFYYKFIILTLFIGSSAFAYYLFWKQKTNKCFYIFCYFLLLISPWLISFLFGGTTPLRAFQSAAYLISFLWVLTFLSFENRKLTTALALLSLFIVLMQTQQIALLFQSNYLRYQRDIRMANKIEHRISELGLGDIPEAPVVFVGELQNLPTEHNIFRSELIGATFFNWGTDTYMRTMAFLRDLGYAYNAPTAEAQAQSLIDAKNMPSWPDKNSVALKNNVIIVKFSSP